MRDMVRFDFWELSVSVSGQGELYSKLKGKEGCFGESKTENSKKNEQGGNLCIYFE